MCVVMPDPGEPTCSILPHGLAQHVVAHLLKFSLSEQVLGEPFDAVMRLGYSYAVRRFDNQLAGA